MSSSTTATTTSTTATTTTTTQLLPTQTVCSLMLGRPNATTSTTTSTTTTTSDPSYTQSIPITLWIGQIYTTTCHQQKWMYFSYHETDKQTFPHTAALLDRYLVSSSLSSAAAAAAAADDANVEQPVGQAAGRLLVTREVAPKNDAQHAVFDALANWCVQNYNHHNHNQSSNHRNDNDTNDDIVEVHNSTTTTTPIAAAVSKEAATATLDQTLQETLSADNYLTLQASTDFTLSIRKALVWTMQMTGVVLDTTMTTSTFSFANSNAGNNNNIINNNNTPFLSITPGILPLHLRIDRTAASAIHLWPIAGSWGASMYHTASSCQNNNHHHHNKPHPAASLWGLLSQPLYTTAGKRLLEAWLRQPVAADLQLLQARQDAVALLVQRSVGRDALRQEGLRLFQSSSGAGGDLSALIVFLANHRQQQQQQQQQQSEDSTTKHSPAAAAPVVSTRKALQALYQLYQVSAQKLPLLLEQVETALAHDLEPPSATTTTAAAAAAAANDEDTAAATTTTAAAATASTLLRDHVLLPLRQGHAELQRSVQLCEAVLDLDAAPREFLVQAQYDERLQELQTELQQVQDELAECHDNMNAQWEQATGQSNAVRLETVADNAEWQFRLPNTNDSKILQQQQQHQLFGGSSRVTIHRLLKNGVYFSTKPLRQLACKTQELRAEYDRHQKQIAADALHVARSYVSCLEQVRDAVALLDVLAALAHVAAYSPAGTYCRPLLTDSEEDGAGIELKQARHPCVELQENLTEFIPNDVSLKFGESSFLLVTGPNMGGKSTYIRALGAIVTLAQIGSFVPCESAKINLCHHILARVGAGDLQERGISTFMAEMLESSSILRTATKRSLIIIDELGRGTSTFDGYGLARAISEYICQKIGCMTVFATHFHELTALEEQEACVQNCHVTARKGSHGLTFLYQVKPGPCLESFGIQVAEMAQVPAVVIQDAKRKAEELENFEYRPKRAREGDDNNNGEQDTTGQDAHASAEESAAALAWMNRFRRLPESVFTREYGSDEEKRAAFVQLLQAS